MNQLVDLPLHAPAKPPLRPDGEGSVQVALDPKLKDKLDRLRADRTRAQRAKPEQGGASE